MILQYIPDGMQQNGLTFFAPLEEWIDDDLLARYSEYYDFIRYEIAKTMSSYIDQQIKKIKKRQRNKSTQ